MSYLLSKKPRRSLVGSGLFLVLFASCALGARSPQEQCGPRLRNLDKLNVKAPVVLETPRLTVRTPRSADIDDLLRIYQDDETVRYTWFWQGTGYWTRERLAALYERNARSQRSKKRYDFVIVSPGHPTTTIGRCALYAGVGVNSWEMGITIYRPYWGNRYAAEVIRRVMKYAFVELGARDVRFRTEPEHRAMLVQYERMGIPKVIDASEDVPEAPTFHHYHHFAVTRAQWDEGIGR